MFDQPCGPAKEKDAGKSNSCRAPLPPWTDVVFISNEKGPLLLILNVEIIINGYLCILPWVSFGQLLYELLVIFCCRLISRKEIQNYFNLKQLFLAFYSNSNLVLTSITGYSLLGSINLKSEKSFQVWNSKFSTVLYVTTLCPKIPSSK